VGRPVVFALSNPSSKVEATPTDITTWSEGQAVVATGSPFPPVEWQGEARVVGQANNVFVFPGIGLGAMVSEARTISDRMFLMAARALASAVSDERLAQGTLYPPVEALGTISKSVAVAVAAEAAASGLAGIPEDTDLDRAVSDAMWWPDYVPYLRAGRGVRHRRLHREDGEGAASNGQPQASRSRHLATSSRTS
jgi:malic enzyme